MRLKDTWKHLNQAKFEALHNIASPMQNFSSLRYEYSMAFCPMVPPEGL